MHACMHAWMDGWMYGCMDGCMGVWMYGCMRVWVYGCVDVWMFVSVYVAASTSKILALNLGSGFRRFVFEGFWVQGFTRKCIRSTITAGLSFGLSL